jgi:hypothetical protein
LVENSGSITSAGGKVYLLGTGEAILDISGTGLIGYSIGNVTGQTVHIREDALSDVMRAVVNTGGLVEAGSIVDDGSGTIQLVGAGGVAVNTGTISVSGTGGLSGGSVVLNSTNASVNTHRASLLADGSGLASNGGSILILSQDDAYFRGTMSANGGTTVKRVPGGQRAGQLLVLWKREHRGAGWHRWGARHRPGGAEYHRGCGPRLLGCKL